MVNLFAYRTPDPSALKRVRDPVGPSNRRAVKRACNNADLVVAAWGAHGSFNNQVQRWMPLLSSLQLSCFGLTRSQQPIHPLYQRSDATLESYDINLTK